MRKQLFQSVCDRLKLIQKNAEGDYIVAPAIDENLAIFRHFDLWNQQLEYLDEEQAFNTPAVFIEFLPINWRQQSLGARDASVSLNLHVVTRRNMPTRTISQYGADALDFFALLDALNLCLHGHRGEQFGGFTSVVSTTDNNYDELMHSTEQYVTLVTDLSAVKPQHKTAAAAIVSFT